MSIRLQPAQYILQPINDQDVKPLGNEPLMRTGIITQAYSPQMSYSVGQIVLYFFTKNRQFAVLDIIYEIVDEDQIQFEQILDEPT